MSTFIKKAENIKDFKIIEALAREIWNEHYIYIISKEQIEYMLKKFQTAEAVKAQTEENYIYFLVTYENEYAGYCAIKPETDGIFLSKLYIMQKYRGNGLSKKLLDYILEVFLEKKPFRIHLTVNKHNVNSIAAYKKMGYKIFNECKFDIGNGYVMDDYEMQRFY